MIAAYAANGQITFTVDDPVPTGYVDFLRESGEALIEVSAANAATQYVADGALTERPMLSPDATDGKVFSNVPQGTQVYVDGQLAATVDDGVIDLRSAGEGSFDVVISPPFPYRPIQVTVTGS